MNPIAYKPIGRETSGTIWVNLQATNDGRISLQPASRIRVLACVGGEHYEVSALPMRRKNVLEKWAWSNKTLASLSSCRKLKI